jgi:hypothetical protein
MKKTSKSKRLAIKISPKKWNLLGLINKFITSLPY